MVSFYMHKHLVLLIQQRGETLTFMAEAPAIFKRNIGKSKEWQSLMIKQGLDNQFLLFYHRVGKDNRKSLAK